MKLKIFIFNYRIYDYLNSIEMITQSGMKYKYPG